MEPVTLAFAADTQAPMFVETLWLRSHNNRTATRLLFEDVAMRKPGAFFLLGDVVNLGYAERQWKPIDKYLALVRSKEVPVHAILGNHEVMGRPYEGMRKFQQRFPDHVATGYIVKQQTIAVLLINSNFSSLSMADEKQQVSWYNDILSALEADASIQFIITCLHHSPFTNSRIVKPSKEVEEKYVPAFLGAKKTCLFLSGHSHNFEHYKVKGKDFLVIGGGGGLRQPLRQGLGTVADIAGDYKPMFHYITVVANDNELDVTTYHINKDFTGFEEGRKLTIKENV